VELDLNSINKAAHSLRRRIQLTRTKRRTKGPIKHPILNSSMATISRMASHIMSTRSNLRLFMSTMITTDEGTTTTRLNVSSGDFVLRVYVVVCSTAKCFFFNFLCLKVMEDVLVLLYRNSFQFALQKL